MKNARIMELENRLMKAQGQRDHAVAALERALKVQGDLEASWDAMRRELAAARLVISDVRGHVVELHSAVFPKSGELTWSDCGCRGASVMGCF